MINLWDVHLWNHDTPVGQRVNIEPISFRFCASTGTFVGATYTKKSLERLSQLPIQRIWDGGSFPIDKAAGTWSCNADVCTVGNYCKYSRDSDIQITSPICPHGVNRDFTSTFSTVWIWVTCIIPGVTSSLFAHCAWQRTHNGKHYLPLLSKEQIKVCIMIALTYSRTTAASITLRTVFEVLVNKARNSTQWIQTLPPSYRSVAVIYFNNTNGIINEDFSTRLPAIWLSHPS